MKKSTRNGNGNGSARHAIVEVRGATTKPMPPPKKTKTKLGNKGPKPLDMLIGQRVRIRRNELGLSQEALAKSLGVSFQQVQKYEKGVNRISGSRLMEIAKVLDTSTSHFLDDHSIASQGTYGDFMMTREGPMLLDAMVAIKNVELRRVVIALARSLAGI